MRDENDSGAELDARPLDREAARELYLKLRASLLAKVDAETQSGAKAREKEIATGRTDKTEWQQEAEEAENRSLARLRLQARVLLAEETKEKTE